MSTVNTNAGFWDRFFDGGAEYNRYAIISAVLLIVGCLGGLTVGYGAIDHLYQLFLIIIPTMTTLSLLLAVAPLKYILNMAALTVVIDVVFLIINFLS
tara:strand:- start:90869 stop:91162 length:294 start_codon:yes stop_codon:yes gene_type:complete